jgi:hypothetical protein
VIVTVVSLPGTFAGVGRCCSGVSRAGDGVSFDANRQSGGGASSVDVHSCLAGEGKGSASDELRMFRRATAVLRREDFIVDE